MIPPSWLRGMFQAGWPAPFGLFAGLCGLLMLGASWYVETQAQLLPATTELRSGNASPAANTGMPFSRPDAVFAPAQSTHLDDLALLFSVAKDKGVGIGPIEYRVETNTGSPLQTRTLELRVNEDYPKLKSFIAEVLQAMPNVSLQEIRIDRKDAAAVQGQVTLKLAFVYQAAANSTPAVPGNARTQPSINASGEGKNLP